MLRAVDPTAPRKLAKIQVGRKWRAANRREAVQNHCRPPLFTFRNLCSRSNAGGRFCANHRARAACKSETSPKKRQRQLKMGVAFRLAGSRQSGGQDARADFSGTTRRRCGWILIVKMSAPRKKKCDLFFCSASHRAFLSERHTARSEFRLVRMALSFFFFLRTKKLRATRAIACLRRAEATARGGRK